MSQSQVAAFKPKKSVALSGVTAGNTALCSVGKTGNDLHYRGYDILDVADRCEFEEIAYLLVHGKLPTAAELKGYKAKLKALRGLPASVKAALESLPAASHPMDVMRTGVSALGCTLPEKDDHSTPGARDIAEVRQTERTGCDSAAGQINRLETGALGQQCVVGIDCTDYLQWGLFLHRLAEGCTCGIQTHVFTLSVGRFH
jgi:citrate synthase